MVSGFDGIYFLNTGDATFTDCVFKDNVSNSAPLIVSYYGDLVLNAVDFRNNSLQVEGALVFIANGTDATLIDNCFSGNVAAALAYIELETGASLVEASGNYQEGNSLIFPCNGLYLGQTLICQPFTGTSCRGDSMGDDMVSITNSPMISPSASPVAATTTDAPVASPSGSPTASPSAGPNASPSAAPQVTTTTTGAPVAATTTDAPVASPSGSPTASPSAGPNASPSAAPQVAITTTVAPVAAATTDAPVASPTTVSAGFQARMWKMSASGTTLFGAVFVMMCM